MRPRLRALAAALGIGAALSAGAALGQQPPPPSLQQRPAPAPGQQQPIQIQRMDPNQLPPNLRGPNSPFGPGGALGRPPGAPPGARFPPGKRPPPRRAAPPPEPEESGSAHAEEEEFCPGHGPTDPPPQPNWWRGILMANNELAESPNPLFKLLFRYEDKDDPCNPKNMPPPFLAQVLNFGILAFILYRFGRKPLAEALVKRKQAITAEMDLAEKLLKDAEDRLQEYEEKLERMEETTEELRAEFAASAEREKAHVLADAEERRARMRRDVEFRIEQELKSARAELLQEAVAGAVVAAEQLLAAKVGPGDLDRLADDYLSSVGAAIHAAKPAAPAQGARS